MQQSIIDYIFLCDERIYSDIPQTKKYEKASDEAYKQYEKLQKLLNEEQNDQLEEFIKNEMAANAEMIDIHFKAGLKIGMRLAFECFSNQ